MAKVVGEGGGAATTFLADMRDPAIRIERTLDTIDSSFVGGHAVVKFDGLRLAADSVLGEVGSGFRHAKVRLAPDPADALHALARIGGLGSGKATHHARRRTAFGKAIGE